MVIDITKKKQKFFYLQLTWEDTKLPSPAPKSLQLLEGCGAREGGLRCHVERWPGGPGPSHAPWEPPLPSTPFGGLTFSPPLLPAGQGYPGAPTRRRKRLLVRMVALLRLRSGERDRSQVQNCRRAVSRSCGSCSWAHSSSSWRVGGKQKHPLLGRLKPAGQQNGGARTCRAKTRLGERPHGEEPRAKRKHMGDPCPRDKKTQ